MTIPKSIIKPIKGTLRSLAIATGILYICLIGAGAYVYLENNTTRQALCSLRGDLELRTEASEQFLASHPHGIPKLGVTAASIQETVHNQKRTIYVLDTLDC